MNGMADASYKFGAGRYIMQKGLLETAGDEIKRYGTKPLIVGGPTAIGIIRERLDVGLKAAGMDGHYTVHPGHVCHDAAKAKAAEGRENGCDVVVCAGGGRAMDFGKLVAYYMESPVVCMPTSVSTCASYSPFSVTYTPEGQTLPGNFCYDLENTSILIDMDIMAHQPARYVVSGLLDSMGKFTEIKNGSREMPVEGTPLSLYAAYLLTKYTFEQLESKIDKVLTDLEKHEITQELEDIVFINIPLTGIISGLSRGVGQSAIAHDLYYQLRYLFTADVQKSLHGEMVGLGIIPQLYYNGETEKCEPFRAFLKKLGAPCCLTETGFILTDENFEKLCSAMENSIYVGKDEASRKRFREGMELIRA